MDLINTAGTIGRDGNAVFALHDGQWVQVGTVMLGQFLPHFPKSLDKPAALGLQAQAMAAFAGGKTRSIFGALKRLVT